MKDALVHGEALRGGRVLVVAESCGGPPRSLQKAHRSPRSWGLR